ncbi:MAG: type II secretion system minor pseudopilin GspH [Gammaproteobacteria bacterium]
MTRVLEPVSVHTDKQPASRRLFAFAGNRQSGFTLLEIMLVIVIIGIVMSFVTISIGGDRRGQEMDREVKRFMALMELASSEATLRSQQMAIRIGEEDYAFYALQNQQWVPFQNDREFRLREMPKGMKLFLEIEDSPLSALKDPGENDPDDYEEDEEEAAEPPQVFLLSSGEVSPFSVTFSAPETEKKVRIEINLLGDMEIVE